MEIKVQSTTNIYNNKNMKKTFLTLSFLLTVAAVFFLIKNNFFQSSSRAKYEAFINQTALKLKPVHEAKKEDVKSADQPDMAALQEYFKTVDPQLKRVPVKRLIKAYQQTLEIEREQKSQRDYSPDIQWTGTGANMGGRTRMIMFDPNDPTHKKVWAGGVTGGLWYNNDITASSSSWVPVGDFWSDLAISCMAYDPNNSQTMYVGTGEAQTARIIYRKSSGVGAGIFKTTDGGETWNLMPSTENFAYVTDLIIKDENGTSVLYAGVASGTYEGENHQSLPSDGLYRSDDNGTTWTQVLPEIPNTFGAHYAVADIELASNGRIFVGTMENLNMEGGATILYSDSGLSGSWTIYDNYNGIISNDNTYNKPARTILASAPSDPNRVYAQFAAGYNNGGFIYYRGRYMAKSSDNGNTWTSMPIPDPEWSTLAWHAFDLQVSPTNPNTLFSGGLDLWRSSNAGSSWRHVSDWSLMYQGGGDGYVHADQHHIVYQPGSASTAIFSSDGGVFLTNTANNTQPVFMQRNKGYNTLQFYTCAIKPTSGPHQYMGGLQDNGTLKYTGTPLDLFDMIDGGDGAFCFWDQNEASVTITSVYYNQYTAYSNGNAVSWFGGNSGTFISPADYDYNNNILYSNAVGFFGSLSNQLLRAKNIPFSVQDELISIGTSTTVPFSCITYSPYSPVGTSTLFVGTESGKLYKVVNAQDSPETTEIGSPDFPTANMSCIALGHSEDTILITFSNYGVSSVWQTYDGGNSWQEKEGNLPDMPIRWALYHPQNSGQALLATELGIWATNTLSQYETVWSPAVDGMANVRTDMLKIRLADNLVFAATHGRGVFTATYYKDIYDGEKEMATQHSNLTIFPNPASQRVTIRAMNLSSKVRLVVLSINGKMVLKKTLATTNGKLQYQMDVSTWIKGMYLLRLKNDGKLITGKLVVQ